MTDDVLYLRLEHVVGSLLLRVSPDPNGEQRAFARVAGRALAYLDLRPEDDLRARLSELARAFAQDTAGASDDDAVVALIARVASRVLPGARVTFAHRVSTKQVVPHWHAAIRSGEPTPGEPWPFDAELTGLRIGSRRLLLREWQGERAADRDARWLSSHGLRVRSCMAGDERRVLFAARDDAMLEEAIAFDARVHDREARDWQDAVRWMGDALGYPPCCVERFLRVRRRDDLSLLVDLLPPVPAPPASPLTCWIDGALALLSFAPCSPYCPAARELASRLLAALDKAHPGFEQSWARYARALHVIDERGACWVLRGDGPLDSFVVHDAIVLEPGDAEAPAPSCTTIDSLRGTRLTFASGRLIDTEGHLRASLIADHRGAAGERNAPIAASSPATSDGDGVVTPSPGR